MANSPVVRTLTLAVASDVLRRLVEWDRRGHRLEAAVNVPYRMLDDEELITGLRELLEKTGIEPERLTLEVVPSGPGAGSSIDEKQIKRLRRVGVRLSLDDLGRASSIAAIRTLPLDQAKIDAMFLHNLGRDERSRAIVRSLVELAHELRLEVVAEGIETRLAWETAAQLGCDRGQGYYFGHPLSAHELAAWFELASSAYAPEPQLPPELAPHYAAVPKAFGDLPDSNVDWKGGPKQPALTLKAPEVKWVDFFPGDLEPKLIAMKPAGDELRLKFASASSTGPLRGLAVAEVEGKTAFYAVNVPWPSK